MRYVKKMKKLFLCIAAICICGSSMNVFAANVSMNNKFDNMVETLKNAQFNNADWKNSDFAVDKMLSKEMFNSEAYIIKVDDGEKGVIITDKEYNIIAFSENNVSLDDESVDIILSMIEKADTKTSRNNSTSYAYVSGNFGTKVLSGLSPQLQNSDNCVVTAASNVLWYYGNNGYPELISSYSWDRVKKKVKDAYIDIYTLINGVEPNPVVYAFQNNNTPIALSQYLRKKNLSTSAINSSVHWNPSYTILKNEIDAGRPCMLGYIGNNTVEGSPFNGNHMTMACGYTTLQNKFYAYVAYGHQVAPMYYLWDTSYNDCVITIRMTY